MEEDELAARRDKPDAAPSPSARSGKPTNGGGTRERRLPLWRWFSQQTAHSDSARAAAAKHVRERWDLPTKKFSAIDRALAAEDSEYLVAFRQLLDEYRIAYEIAPEDDDFARETGVGGPLLPFAPEMCQHCSREAVPGTGACARHGGQWISPKDAQDLSRRIHDRVLTMSEAALRVLQELMDNGRSEQVRMMAATAILDRAGVGPHMNVNHSGEVTINDAEKAAIEVRARLDRLALNVAERDAAVAAAMAGDNVIDAEIVEQSKELLA